MRILHVCIACTYTEGFTYQENYLTKYHAKKHETYLITNQYMFQKGNLVKSEDIEYVNADGVHVIRVKDFFQCFPRKINFYIGIYKNFEKELKRIKPDIIFIHNIQFNDIRAIARYVKKHPDVTVYVDNHSDFSNSGTNMLSRFILNTEWRKCAHVIEPYTKKFYGVLPVRVDFLVKVYHLPEEKCKLLVMGADDETVQKANKTVCSNVRKKYGIRDDDFLIVTGGKIDLFKMQTLNLLEAIKKIDNPKVKLIIFGSVVKELKDKIDSFIDEKIIFYEPWLTSEQSYFYFGAADLAVFPGRHSVYWEQAAGQGIPLVCKYWEGTTHIDCGGNVVFLKEDNTNEIVDVIKKLIDYPEKYRKMKEIAINKAMKIFSYKAIAKRAIEEQE